MSNVGEEELEGCPTSWKLLGCDNGLRFFQEVLDTGGLPTSRRGKPLSVVKSIGVIDAPADHVCHLVLDYGPSRTRWDSSMESAHVLEAKDAKTDVVQLTLRHGGSCLDKQNSLLLLRWWGKHADGSYVIFFKTLPALSWGRQASLTKSTSWLDCGAYIIRPIDIPAPQSTHSPSAADPSRPAPGVPRQGRGGTVVELVLETEAPGPQAPALLRSLWNCCCGGIAQLDALPVNPRQVDAACWQPATRHKAMRDSMLHSVAGLREFCSSGEVPITDLSRFEDAPPPRSPSVGPVNLPFPASPQNLFRWPWTSISTQGAAALSGSGGETAAGGRGGESDGLKQPLLKAVESDGAEDSFEECMGETLSDPGSTETQMENALAASMGTITRVAVDRQPADDPLSIIDWSRHQGSVRRGYTGEGELRNCWMPPEGTNFSVRGKTYYEDGAKTEAGPPLGRLVAVDWLHGKQPMAGLAGRSANIVQRVRAEYKEQAPFFMVLNLQVPAGSKDHYSLVFYFAIPRGSACLKEGTRLHEFIHTEDDAFRRRRLTLIPAIPQGSWLVRNAVGSDRFVMLAQVLETSFVRDPAGAFFEMDVNMGTSAVVRGIVGLAINCMSMLTVDYAFFVKALAGEELPESLFGSARCCNLDLNAAVAPPKE